MSEHLPGNSRGFKSSSLDALQAANQQYNPRPSLPKMESFSYEELQNLDKLEESNILRHLASDLRKSSSEHLGNSVTDYSRTAAVNTGNLFVGPRRGNLVARSQNDLSCSSPSPKGENYGYSEEAVIGENAALRMELETMMLKVARLQKLEAEVDNIQQLYLSLLQSTNKRENLEKAMRSQLEREKQTILQENHQLREHMESISRQMSQRSPVVSEEDYKATIKDYQIAIARLTAQNKELIEGRKRQDIELAAQRATLDEQRNHINILDSALTSAQTNQHALEEELKKRNQPDERLRELQQLLSASTKREQLEKKARVQLEEQVLSLKKERQTGLAGFGSSISAASCPVSSALPQETRFSSSRIPSLPSSESVPMQSDISQLEATVQRLELQLREKDALVQMLQRPTQPSPSRNSAHHRVESQDVKDSVSGSSASTSDLRTSAANPPRPKSAASVFGPSQLWEI